MQMVLKLFSLTEIIHLRERRVITAGERDEMVEELLVLYSHLKGAAKDAYKFAAGLYLQLYCGNQECGLRN